MGRKCGTGISLGLIQGYVEWVSGSSFGIDTGLWGDGGAVGLVCGIERELWGESGAVGLVWD